MQQRKPNLSSPTTRLRPLLTLPALALSLAGCAQLPALDRQAVLKPAAEYASQQAFATAEAAWPAERWRDLWREPDAPAQTGFLPARQFCKDRNTTNTTKNRASNKVLYTSWIDCDIYSVASKGNLYSNPSGKFWLISFIASFTFVATSSALAPGNI